MIRCEGQKAECYQSGYCQFCQTNGGNVIENGLRIDMFDEPNEWIHNLISVMFLLGIAASLVWIGWLCAKII